MVNTLRQQTQAAGGQLVDEAEDLYDIFLAVNNFDGPDTGYIITISFMIKCDHHFQYCFFYS